MSSSPSLLKELFDLGYQNKSTQLKISIQVDRSFLYATHYDEQNHQYVGLKAFNLIDSSSWDSSLSSIKEALATINIKDSQSVKVFLTDPLYTLVPSSIFDKTNIEAYLSFNHPLTDIKSYVLYFNKLHNNEIVLAYAVPKKIVSFFENLNSNFKIFHYAHPLLEYFLLEKNKLSKIGLHVQRRHFDIIYLREGQLHYFNSFNYKTNEDILYYLLYSMEQLDLNREEIRLTLFGELDIKTEFYNLIRQYVKNVEVQNRSNKVSFSQVLNGIPKHYYHTLFNQYLCE